MGIAESALFMIGDDSKVGLPATLAEGVEMVCVYLLDEVVLLPRSDGEDLIATLLHYDLFEWISNIKQTSASKTLSLIVQHKGFD